MDDPFVKDWHNRWENILMRLSVPSLYKVQFPSAIHTAKVNEDVLIYLRGIISVSLAVMRTRCLRREHPSCADGGEERGGHASVTTMFWYHLLLFLLSFPSSHLSLGLLFLFGYCPISSWERNFCKCNNWGILAVEVVFSSRSSWRYLKRWACVIC